MENNNQNQINIELPEEIADGEYANLAIITHSIKRFVVDFVRLYTVFEAKITNQELS